MTGKIKIMKIKTIILFVATVLFLNFSCSKDVISDAIDCVGESFFMKIKHTTNGANPKKIDFTIEYSGVYTIKSIKVSFGDGTSATITGNTVSHEYASAGTFTVKADITIQKGKENCTSSPTKSVTVN